MQEDQPEQKIELYRGPAGGWGAVKSVARELTRHRVATKGSKTLLSANQPGGFDCPGCAWPDSTEPKAFDFCENGVKAVAAEMTADKATPEVISAFTVSELSGKTDYELEALGRLTEPMVYDPISDRYQRTSWDQAFATIGTHLRSLADPNEAIFYTSGRTSNEAAFMYQLFVRAYGTNNFPDCSNMCHEPSGVALKKAIGVGKGTVLLDDFKLADCILIFGQNPGTNHPRMLGELRQAAKRGAHILSFNPLRERGLERFADPQDAIEMATLGSTPISSAYYQLRIGGDIALLSGLCKRLVELDSAANPIIDHTFIAQHCVGFTEFRDSLAQLEWPILESQSGLTYAQIDQAAQTFAAAKRAILCWGMGITQHVDAIDTIGLFANLMLMRGQLGKPGAGLCPVRGHSNVQGDRTMGIYEKPALAFLQKLDQIFSINTPKEHGYDTVGAILAMAQHTAKVFIAMGGNFAAATPDTALTARGLQQCDLTVHISTKLNRSHVAHGKEALILPCLGRTELDLQGGAEQSITVEDSMSMVHLSKGVNEPASIHLLSEPAIVARMALASLDPTKVNIPWQEWTNDYSKVRTAIEQVFDEFKGFNERLRGDHGFHLRNAARELEFQTASGKAQFARPQFGSLQALAKTKSNAANHKIFTLTTIRSHDQYNTTIYGLNDRYRGVLGQRRILFINASDIEQMGLSANQLVDIQSDYGDGLKRTVTNFRLVPYDIPLGCLASYFPETNPLVAIDSFAREARTPASKSIPVVIFASKVNHET